MISHFNDTYPYVCSIRILLADTQTKISHNYKCTINNDRTYIHKHNTNINLDAAKYVVCELQANRKIKYKTNKLLNC